MMRPAVIKRLLATRYDRRSPLHWTRADLERAFVRYRRAVREAEGVGALCRGGLLPGAVALKNADLESAWDHVERMHDAHLRLVVGEAALHGY